MNEPPECKDAHLPAASYIDCGPVGPTAALGGRLLALLKSWTRFAAAVPARCVEWLGSFTLVTLATLLYLVTCHTMASLSFIDPGVACLSTARVVTDLQGVRLIHRLHVTLII